MTNTLTVVPSKPDAEVAAELKKKIIEALEPVCKILSEADEAGFEASFHIGLGPLGKQSIHMLKIAKIYK